MRIQSGTFPDGLRKGITVMPQGSSDIITLSALVGTFAVLVVFWHRPWTALAFAALVLIASWVLLTRANEADIQHEFKLIEAKKARGEQLSLDNQLFDGTGDRVVVLLMGWLPAGIGVALGSAVAFGIRRFRGRPAAA